MRSSKDLEIFTASIVTEKGVGVNKLPFLDWRDFCGDFKGKGRMETTGKKRLLWEGSRIH
jgi:hypothetical protein